MNRRGFLHSLVGLPIAAVAVVASATDARVIRLPPGHYGTMGPVFVPPGVRVDGGGRVIVSCLRGVERAACTPDREVADLPGLYRLD